MARLTGLEPATPGVTGRYSNQLSYNRTLPAQSLGRRRVHTAPALPRQAPAKTKIDEMQIFSHSPSTRRQGDEFTVVSRGQFETSVGPIASPPGFLCSLDPLL